MGGGGKNRKINKRPPSFIRHLRVQSDESFNNQFITGWGGRQKLRQLLNELRNYNRKLAF